MLVDGDAVRVVENCTGAGPEATDRYPVPPSVDESVAGNRFRTCEEMVSPPAPAVVIQVNPVAVVTVFAPDPEVVPE
jgi:hypothetical protein